MIPKRIYEVLPFIYILAGTVSVMGLDLSTGRVSGLLLMTAGVIIFKMRVDYRSQLRRKFWTGT